VPCSLKQNARWFIVKKQPWFSGARTV